MLCSKSKGKIGLGIVCTYVCIWDGIEELSKPSGNHVERNNINEKTKGTVFNIKYRIFV